MNNLEIKKYIFSGHDSFQCRDLWLKKGFDFIKNGHSFSDTDAVVISYSSKEFDPDFPDTYKEIIYA